MSIVSSEPFDCSGGDDDDNTLEILSCIKNGPQWWQIGRQVAWSLVVWFILVASSPATSKFWNYSCDGIHPYWVQQYVGTKYRLAHNLNIEAVLCFAQVFGSFFSVWMWVIKSYSIHNGTVSDEIYAIEVGCVVLSFSHTLFERIKFDFSMKHALSFSVFLDCLTIPPIIMQRSGPWAGGSWLTLGYLRAYHCLTPIKRLVELEYFDRLLSNFAQQCTIAVLESVLVVFSIAGTLWIMESLGDIEGFSDQFFDSGMGEISFFQMIYFTFVTISTVGFGDYSPTTVLSRGFIIFAILGGVSFFSHISVYMVNLIALESSGRGKFYPTQKTDRGHILVMGGGVTCGSITVLETFMRALCRNDSHYDTPDIVLMGQTSCSEEVRAMLKCEWAMGYELQYFIGSPLNPDDLIRVRASEASMVFIIADIFTTDTSKEDRENALIAAALQKLNPNVQYRLMLCSMNSRELSSNIGLSEFNCFSLESLKAAMLGTSHRCPGFSTLILNLGLPDLPVPNSPFSSEIVHGDNYGIWLREYAIGCSYEPYGFIPHEMLIGLTFKEAALKTAELTDVLLMAAQIDGGIRINPSRAIIKKTTILFGLSRHPHAVTLIAKDNDVNVASWIERFQKNRRRGQFGSRHHSKFVCVRTEQEVEAMYAASLGNSSLVSSSQGNTPLNPSLDDTQISLSADALLPKEDISENDKKRQKSEKQEDSQSTTKITNRSINIDSSRNIEDKTVSNVEVNPKTNKFPKKSLDVSSLKHLNLHQNVSKIKMETTEEEINILRKQVKLGGHTVIIVQEDADELDQQTVWEQLGVIVDCLIFAKDFTSLVVVHGFSAISSRCRWMKTFGHKIELVQMSFCVGDILNPITLQGAGCHTCARILTLAPSAPMCERVNFDGVEMVIREEDKKDENNILLMMLLEEYRKVWKRSDTHIIFDWYSPSAMNLLSVPLLTDRRGKRNSNDDTAMSTAMKVSPSASSVSTPTISETELYETNTLKEEEEEKNNENNFEIDKKQENKTNESIKKKISNFIFGTSAFKVLPIDSSTPSALISKDKISNASIRDYVSNIKTLKNQKSIKLYHSEDENEMMEKNELKKSFSLSKKKLNMKNVLRKVKISNNVFQNFHDDDTDDSDESDNEKIDKMEKIEKKEKIKKIKLDREQRWSMDEDDLIFSNEHPRGNCRFAAGFTIPKPFVASLYSMAYYTPGFLELIEALLNPAEYDQESIPWLFMIPSKYEGQEYSNVAFELLRNGTLPLGLLRPGGVEVGTPFPYVVTLVPSSNLAVSSEDSIYVLADPTWANEEAIKLGYMSAYHKEAEKQALKKKLSSVFLEPTPTSNS